MLLEKRADAALTNRFGSTPLQIAQRAAGGANGSLSRPTSASIRPIEVSTGRAERAINRELQRKLRFADREEEDLRKKLSLAIASRERLEAQLGPSGAEAMRAESIPPSPRGTEDAASSAAAEQSEHGAEVPGDVTAELAQEAADSAEEAVSRQGSMLKPPPSSSRPESPPVFEEPPRPKSPPRPAANNAIGDACEYWRTMTEAMAKARASGEEAMKRSFLRDLPAKEDPDSVSWTKEYQAEQTLALPDPDDPELAKAYDWLKEVAVERRNRHAFKGQVISSTATKLADCGEGYIQQVRDQGMKSRTGKTQAEWNEFVSDLEEKNCAWDWSSLEVRLKPHDCAALSRAGVYAVDKKTSPQPDTKTSPQPAESSRPIFRGGDVVGPVSGVLRRLSKYVSLYYADRKLALHDPGCYVMSLRVETTEMKLDALCVDLRAGPGQNRLRYLADVRVDPLGLRALLQLDPESGPRSVLPPRNRMPRPRSRPGSPERGPYGRMQDTTLAPVTPLAMQAVPDEEGTGANVSFAEVLIDGYPHVFVVATRPIYAGEELLVDYGEDYWACQRAMLTRFLEIGRLGREMVNRIDSQESQQGPEEEKETFELPERNRVRRVGEAAVQ